MRLGQTLAALGHEQFRLLFAGQAISALGDSLVPVALAFAVIDLTGSPSDLGFVLAAGLVPRVLLVLAGGVWADRLPRQLVMLAADVLRATTQALVAAVLLTGSAHVWHLIVLSAVFGAGSAFFAPAAMGLVPQTVPANALQNANALRGLSGHVAWTIGPGISGAIVATAGPGWVFVVDAATFAVSVVFLARMRVSRAVPPGATRSFVEELRHGLAELRSRTWLWASVLEFALWNLAIAPVWVLGPVVASRSLNGASSWGVIVTCGGLGSIIGALAALRLRPRRPLLALNIGCAFCCVLPFFLAWSLPTAAIAVSAVVCFVAIAFANAVWESTLQRSIPVAALSRVSSYDIMGSLVLNPVGMAIAGPVAAGIGLRPTLVIAGCLITGTSLAVLALADVRRLARVRPEPGPATVPAVVESDVARR